MATAKQLPSGHWRCRIYDNELKKQVSFTSTQTGKRGKSEAELMAKQYSLNPQRTQKKEKTVGECIDLYIESKTNVLSPTTISGYEKIKRNWLVDFCDLKLSEVSNETIQLLVNQLALNKSPKTVKSSYGLLVSVLKAYAPEISLNVTLPKQQKRLKKMPNPVDVYHAVKGSDIELPCLLAMWLGLRMSEVRGAKKSDIQDGILTIKDTIVTVDGIHIKKNSTKTFDSTRSLQLPRYILDLIDKLPAEQVYLTDMSGQAIYKKLSRLLEKNDLDHITFHDLRHLNASIMLMLNIPDKYAMERGGWSSPNIMKSVYQHTFSDERENADKTIDKYFETFVK